VPTLKGIDDQELSLRAWLHETAGALLRALRIRADPVLVDSPYLNLMLRARSIGKVETTMNVDADYVFQLYEEQRALYTDFLTGFMLPRTTIWNGDELMIAVNSLGCRGPEVDPGLPVVAFLGDSTTMGLVGTAGGQKGESWVQYVDLPGYAVLNGGVEGLEMGAVRRRYEALRSHIPLTCAVFYVGWHNLIYNERTPEYWEENLQSFLSSDHQTVLCSLATPLLPEMRERGIGPLVNESPEANITDDFFHFWRGKDTDESLVELIDAHKRYNAYLTEFCTRTGTPLIDLDAFLRPESYDEATRDFFDVCHFRPRVLPKVAELITSELRSILPNPAPSVAGWRRPAELPAPEGAEDLRKHIYPLW
jgi:hypothetical protein